MKINNLDESDVMDSPLNAMDEYWHNEMLEWVGQRIDRWIKSREMGCISAYRGVLRDTTPNTYMGACGENHCLSLAENAERQDRLYATLLYWGYGILVETFDKGVNGIIVLNLKNDSRFYDNLFSLSEYYNQDGFIYKAADGDVAYWVGTNNAPIPGYGKQVEVGYMHRKVDNELIRQIESRLSQMTDIREVMRSMKAPSVSKELAEAKANLERIMDTNIEKYFLKDSLVMHTMYDRMNLTCTARNVIHDMMQAQTENK